MSNNLTRQKSYIKQTNNTRVTNPLKVGMEEYKSVHELNKKSVILERVMFVVLGAIAIYAFYSSLSALML